MYENYKVNIVNKPRISNRSHFFFLFYFTLCCILNIYIYFLELCLFASFSLPLLVISFNYISISMLNLIFFSLFLFKCFNFFLCFTSMFVRFTMIIWISCFFHSCCCCSAAICEVYFIGSHFLFSEHYRRVLCVTFVPFAKRTQF